jgi:hypothetical protein
VWLSAAHPGVFRPIIVIVDLVANEIGGQFSVHVVHDEVPALACGHPKQRKEACTDVLKVNVLVNILLIPNIRIHLNAQNHVDKDDQPQQQPNIR